jgi:hypothetical protein
MAERLIPLFRTTHPEIEFVTHEEVAPERYYATYSIGLFFDDKDGHLPALRFSPCRVASHRRIHPRGRPDGGGAADRARG